MNPETKKTEKLASAIYLLTSFFDEKEPMKWRLRELAQKLVSAGEKRGAVLEITSLLNVAKNAGLISDSNFQIIQPEFVSLISQSQTLEEVFKRIEEEKPSLYIASSLPKSAHVSASTPLSTPRPVIKDKIREVAHDGAVALKKNGRQDAILGLLKRKREIMIKDVAPLIDGVSEKTIQRELLAMVLSGILKKEGEKRWSRYSLA